MFVPLRLHSVFSRGAGSLTVREAVEWLRRKRVPSAALADLHNVYGWGAWKRAASGGGIKPLFGCEIVVGGRRFVFIARDRGGYWNLMEIFNRGEIRDAAGLIVIYVPDGSGGENGASLGKPGAGGAGGAGAHGRGNGHGADAAGNGNGGQAPKPPWTSEAAMLSDLRARVPAGDFYLGCDALNARRVMEMSGEVLPEPGAPARFRGGAAATDAMTAAREADEAAAGLPVVWANPLKYVTAPERLILLHAIESKVPFPPERDRLAGKVELFGPEQETLAARRLGLNVREAFARTFEVAGKCAFGFEDVVLPLPSDLFPESLRDVVMSRLTAARELSWAGRQRTRRELAAVEESGFAPYFLIVHDVVDFARRRGILHNLRGSGASSFLGWLLGVSHVNPLEFDLYFERFLNRGRPDPPDIDLDFDSRRRDEVLEYVLKTYGSGKTGAAFVCSLKSFGARSALYETLRAFGVPPDEARGHTKRVPYYAEPEMLRTAPPASGFLEAWKLAAQLQDAFHEVSLHVGGVILTPAPAERFLPMEVSAKGLRMTQFDKDAVEDLRLIKLDLLSVRGLAAISETQSALRLKSIPTGDPAVYAQLRAARTIGCFQVESPAMMNLLRRMKPATVHELTQALALVRPGPTESGMKEALLRRRSGRAVPGEPLFRDDGFLARILPETGGILLYEEQVMQIAERVAGMPPEKGDMLRRSLRKGRGGDPGLREAFFREAAERGYTAAEVERLWLTLEKFSSYSFNKAHSASYAHMAYQAVWLKVHHPVPYFAAVLNAGGGYYPPAEYVEEAKRNGIRVLAPDVNRSGEIFTVEDGGIRVGFSSIKNLAVKAVGRILEERSAGGPFVSVEDFLARLKPGKSELLSLIQAGVFDALEPRRTRQVLRYFQGLDTMDAVADVATDEKRRMLYESLGFVPDGDELDLYEGKRPDLRIKDVPDCAGRMVELVVRVIDARQRETYGARTFLAGGYEGNYAGGGVGARGGNGGNGNGAGSGNGGNGNGGGNGGNGAGAWDGGRGGAGDGGFGRGANGGGAWGGVSDRRESDINWGGSGRGGGGTPKYFYLFEDETGLLEGVGETRCVTYGNPPVCFLRGQVRRDAEGVAKILNCSFLKGF